MPRPNSRNNIKTAGDVALIVGLPAWTAATYGLLFVLAFVFYSVIWSHAPIAESDTGTYFKVAEDLANFHISQLHYRTPGYPLLLVLTGANQSPRTLFFVSMMLHFAAIWLLGVVLYRAAMSEMQLKLFSFILLLPPYVEPAGYILSENLTETMLVAAVVSFIFWYLSKRLIWSLLSAGSIGGVALTRPTYQVLAIAVAGWLTITCFLLPSASLKLKDVAKVILVLVLGSVVTVGSYAYFNYRSFGYFGITPILGFSLSQKTVHLIERLPEEYAPVREILIKWRNAEWLTSGGTAVGYIAKAIPELESKTGLDWPRLSNHILRLNLILIQNAPLNYLLEVIRAFASYCFPSSRELANFGSRSIQFAWAILHFGILGAFVSNLVLLIGAIAYIKKGNMCRQSNNAFIREDTVIHFQAFSYGLAGAIVLYTAAISCLVDAGDPRHRVPTDILIVFMLFLGSQLWLRLVNLSWAFRNAQKRAEL